MNREFVPYEQALALKEIGFDEPCFAYYYCYLLDSPVELRIEANTRTNTQFINVDAKSNCISPLYQQALRWFREKHNMVHIINPLTMTAEIDFLDEITRHDQYGDYIHHEHMYDDNNENEARYSSYEEADLACLKRMIEIVKENEEEEND